VCVCVFECLEAELIAKSRSLVAVTSVECVYARARMESWMRGWKEFLWGALYNGSES